MSDPFRDPDDTSPVDFNAARRALPNAATCTGMYIERILAEAEAIGQRDVLIREAKLPRSSYAMFRTYPYTHLIEVCEAAVPLLRNASGAPRTTRRVLRELGWTYFPMLAATLAGRVVFGTIGRDPERVLFNGYRGWQMALNFGSVTARRISDSCVHYEFRDTPAMLDTVSLGVVEGAIKVLGVSGSVRIRQRDIGDADYEVKWSR